MSFNSNSGQVVANLTSDDYVVGSGTLKLASATRALTGSSTILTITAGKTGYIVGAQLSTTAVASSNFNADITTDATGSTVSLLHLQPYQTAAGLGQYAAITLAPIRPIKIAAGKVCTLTTDANGDAFATIQYYEV